MKRFGLILLAVIALIVLGAVYFTRPGAAPPGQSPLVELNNTALASLRDDFNSRSDQLRVILLLSPT